MTNEPRPMIDESRRDVMFIDRGGAANPEPRRGGIGFVIPTLKLCIVSVHCHRRNHADCDASLRPYDDRPCGCICHSHSSVAQSPNFTDKEHQ